MGNLQAGPRARGPGGARREPRGVAQLYLDESVTQSILAGLIVFLGALWALWGAFWLRRVELRRRHDALVADLGLTWAREGLGPSVRASGTIAGRAVEVRWRRALWGERVRARVDGAWTTLGDEAALRELLGVVSG